MLNDCCVYMHTFPNGKKYIGISKNAEARWGSTGCGYNTQPKIARAIRKYGWDKVKHEIIVDELTEKQAKRLEVEFIKAYNTVENGYNVSIGGDYFNASYLTSEASAFVNALKNEANSRKSKELLSFVEWISEAKKEAEFAELVNNAVEAVQFKRAKNHGHKFSITDEFELMDMLGEVVYYFELNDRLIREAEEKINNAGVIH